MRSTINISGSNSTFTPGDKTYNNVTMNRVGGTQNIQSAGTIANLTISGDELYVGNIYTITVTGTLTLTGTSTKRLLLRGQDINKQATFNAANVVASYIDLMNITGTGASNWDLSGVTGGSGNCAFNSGITFTTPVDQHWINSNGGYWDNAANWTSRVPLPQDDVYFDCAFGTNCSVIRNSSNTLRSGKNISWAGATWTTSLTYSNGAYNVIYGSLILIDGLTLVKTSGGLSIKIENNISINTYNCIFPVSLIIDSNNSSLATLYSDFVTTPGILAHIGSGSSSNASIDTNGYSIKAGYLEFLRFWLFFYFFPNRTHEFSYANVLHFLLSTILMLEQAQ